MRFSAALLAFLCALSLRAADPEALKAELRQTEIDFCALAAKDGIDAAFAAYAAPDATFFGAEPGKKQGLEAVRSLYHDTPRDLVLSWEPVYVSVAASGDLGYTWGTYKMTKPSKDGPPIVRTGHYATIWKRQADGSWKYSLDTGEADPTPAKK